MTHDRTVATMPVEGTRVAWLGPMREGGTVRSAATVKDKGRNIGAAQLVVAWDDGVMFTIIDDRWWRRVTETNKLVVLTDTRKREARR